MAVLRHCKRVELTCGLFRQFLFYLPEKTLLEESDDPVVKTVQPSLKTGRKWKVTEAVDEAKECLKVKEVIGQTQTDRRGFGSTTAKRWSKTEGKEKRDMIIDEIRNKEDSTRVQKAVQQPQQGQWTNWGTAI
ncbi:reverse transcriptase [Plakobranchus ocellatus]|uniref:Reverse transcriptase n=1 Tax=Plakobranchus ocellatus TaxID=259542 RepID=A0AAV4A8A6_9GAST|nr:reverse transcriptase [Plakobranchus ocellatus]